MQIELDGRTIRSEQDFHVAIMAALSLPSRYGKNLDALSDVLTTDVERPLQLVWRHGAHSRQAIGQRFDQIVSLLRDVERQDAEWQLPNRFALVLT